MVLSQHFSGGPEENHEKLGEDGRFPFRDLKPVPTEEEADSTVTLGQMEK
jgi:hypothetical protein